MTAAQWRTQKPKRLKYRNKPVVVDGVRFASKAEAARDAELQLLAKAGKIRELKRQPRFPLTIDGQKICTYIGDWEYVEFDDGRFHRVVEDRKGALTAAFKIKWALAKALHPEIEWRLS
jgi:hypothetical protein